jgi:hypothetical protein
MRNQAKAIYSQSSVLQSSLTPKHAYFNPFSKRAVTAYVCSAEVHGGNPLSAGYQALPRARLVGGDDEGGERRGARVDDAMFEEGKGVGEEEADGGGEDEWRFGLFE